MSFNDVVEKVLSILSEFDNAVDLAILVCLYLLNRNVKKGNGSSVSVASDPKQEETVSASPKLIKATKKGIFSEMQEGLDLYYSDKKEEEMTDDEKALFNRIKRYMEDE